MTQATNFFPTDITGLPRAGAPDAIELADGARFDLRIAPVAKKIGEATVRMLAYNGSVPGPVLRVKQGSELWVNVVNDGDLEGTVHWHGLRLENRYDGTAETQAPIPIGKSFLYRLTFPDPGVYWYHPHIREDYGQEMGLYGNIIVEPAEAEYWPPVHREASLTLDDLLIEAGKVAPFSREQASYSAMGRFGNVLLVNGEPTPVALSARRGEVVRFYLTDTANTRVFNVAFAGARMKRVGGDSGRLEKEEMVESVVIAPSERAVVDVLFEREGTVTIEHRTPRKTYELARIAVAGDVAEPAVAAGFAGLRTNRDMVAERERAAGDFIRAPDKTVALVAEMDLGGAAETYICPMHPEVTAKTPDKCPKCRMKLVPAGMGGAGHGHAHGHGDGHGVEPIEWEDGMVEVNRLTTPANTRWRIVDRAGGEIRWRFRVGERVKIRLVNEMDSDHPMHHPFHIHGAGRFLVLARDGQVETNLVWKDTVLVPTGQTVDILLEITNPGRWMAHCHIAEHHESGMMFSFDVTVP